jgi:hypothetical protein
MELTKKALLISSMQITYQKERKKAFKKRKETKLNKIGPNYCGIYFSIQIMAMTSVYALKFK